MTNKNRTEEEKVVQAPLKIVLGGTVKEVPLLPIALSRAWRMEVSAALSKVPGMATVDPEHPEDFANSVDGIFIQIPDLVIDLFFGYARSLDRDAIEQVATDQEIATGFLQIAQVALPLATSLVNTMRKS